MSNSPKKLLSTSTATLLFGGAAHALPALTAIGPLRRLLFQKLSGMSNSPGIALTFDDGPDPKSTPLFLDRLDAFGWKATFFMLGSMADKNPGLTKEVKDRGHEIGVHGYQHINLIRRLPKSTDYDITRAFESLHNITGTPPVFFRPPYGVLTSQALVTSRRLGLTPILWTAWGRDWRAKATGTSVLKDLLPGLAPGNTLLLHDSDCTSARESFLSTLSALTLLHEIMVHRALNFERLCDHYQI